MKKSTMYAWIAVGAVGALYLLWNRKSGGNSGAENAGSAAASIVGDFAAGAIQETGSWIGIPRTDTPESGALCNDALMRQSAWDVSKYCPAATFWDYITGNVTGGAGSGSTGHGATGTW